MQTFIQFVGQPGDPEVKGNAFYPDHTGWINVSSAEFGPQPSNSRSLARDTILHFTTPDLIASGPLTMALVNATFYKRAVLEVKDDLKLVYRATFEDAMLWDFRVGERELDVKLAFSKYTPHLNQQTARSGSGAGLVKVGARAAPR